jgi:hypothetical protein
MRWTIKLEVENNISSLSQMAYSFGVERTKQNKRDQLAICGSRSWSHTRFWCMWVHGSTYGSIVTWWTSIKPVHTTIQVKSIPTTVTWWTSIKSVHTTIQVKSIPTTVTWWTSIKSVPLPYDDMPSKPSPTSFLLVCSHTPQSAHNWSHTRYIALPRLYKPIMTWI